MANSVIVRRSERISTGSASTGETQGPVTENHFPSCRRADAAFSNLPFASRPRTKDGKIDFANPDKGRIRQLDIDQADGVAYDLVVHRLYFSTDVNVPGQYVHDLYRTRFQIEFYFRAGRQFTGLPDCQVRDKKSLDIAYNASLAAINITKVMRKQDQIPFSIGLIKSLMGNAHFIKRFFDLSVNDPNKTLNAKLVKDLLGLATDVA